MKAQIIDLYVLSEVFSTGSEKELKRWGVRECKTLEVQLDDMERVFKLRFDVLEDTDGVSFFFRNPDGKVAVRIESETLLRKGDTLLINYTITGNPGEGPDSCQVRLPSGEYLAMNLYSLAT